MSGRITHRTIITFDFAKPVSSSFTRRMVGLVATSHRLVRLVDVVREQIVERGLDDSDPAHAATPGQRLLDEPVDDRVDGLHRRLALERHAPLAGLALDGLAG